MELRTCGNPVQWTQRQCGLSLRGPPELKNGNGEVTGRREKQLCSLPPREVFHTKSYPERLSPGQARSLTPRRQWRGR